MLARLLGLVLLAAAVSPPLTASADEVDDWLAVTGLRPDEVYRKAGGSAWGDTLRRLFDDQAFDRSYALVIGVSDYQGPWPALASIRNDPDRMRRYLIEKADFDLVVTLVDERANRQRIEELMVDDFPKLVGPRDRFLFYFSGHGTQREIAGTGEVGYLVLGESGGAYSRMISMQDVREWDRLLRPAKQVLFLLDACFSGLAGIQPKAERTELTVERLAGYAHHLVTAGTKDQRTIASGDWNGSVFTDSFLRGVTGAADSESEFARDGVVSLTELMEYIGQRVDREAGQAGWRDRITPQLYDLSGDNEGEFFFIARGHMTQAEPPSSREGPGFALPKSGPDDAGPEAVRIAALDLEMVVDAPGRVPVRAGPGSEHARIAALEPGATVAITGEVEGTEWYRVALLHGGDGYVLRHHLKPPSAVRPAVGIYPEPALPRTFRDCDGDWCPEMVELAGGSFVMGSPADEPGRWDAEGPQHAVEVTAFALGRSEVTFDQWEACVEDGGCAHRPNDHGWGRGDRPVINVSWQDAQDYTRWLGPRTGETYRLPSEAEWEYAARADSSTRFFWGADADLACAFANGYDLNGEAVHGLGRTTLDCDDAHASPAPVSSYRPNPFGLHDMAGNVFEWVQDCWHETYQGAPSDGSAWVDTGCGRRVARGGSWNFLPDFLRSAYRIQLDPDARTNAVGFRVARALDR